MDKTIADAWAGLHQTCSSSLTGEDLKEVERAFEYAYRILVKC